MLYEFAQQLGVIKDLIQQNISIAEDGEADAIDLSALDMVPAELISACFNNTGASRMPMVVAQREANDIIAGHRRLASEYTMDRGDYYSLAVTNLNKQIGLHNYTHAVLQRMDRKGTVE